MHGFANICSQKKKFDRNFKELLGYLVIHGMLHLKGFEHSSRMDREEKKYDQTKYNESLELGDTMTCPFGEGEQCLISQADCYNFLQMQSVNPESIIQEDKNLLAESEFLTGAQLVSIIKRSK